MAPADPDDDAGRVHCRLDELLDAARNDAHPPRELVGVSIVNLSVLKNDRARAIRFSTLTAICEALELRDRGAARPRQLTHLTNRVGS